MFSTVKVILLRSIVDVVEADHTLNGLSLHQARQSLYTLIALNRTEAHDFFHPLWSHDNWIFDLLLFILLLQLMFLDQLHDTVRLNCVADVEKIALCWNTLSIEVREEPHDEVIFLSARPDVLNRDLIVTWGIVDPINLIAFEKTLPPSKNIASKFHRHFSLRRYITLTMS